MYSLLLCSPQSMTFHNGSHCCLSWCIIILLNTSSALVIDNLSAKRPGVSVPASTLPLRRPMSIQFSSAWYLCARKSPCVLHAISQTFPQHCPWNSFSAHLVDDGLLSSLQRRSPQGNRLWIDVLGFVPAGIVSIILTLKIFRDASHQWWLLFPQVCLLGHFSPLWHVLCVKQVCNSWQ